MRRSEQVAHRLPPWMGSVRFRLTLLYSVVLFGLAAIVVGIIYAGLSRTLDDEPVYRRYVVEFPGRTFLAFDTFDEDAFLRNLESDVNERALDHLRTWSFGALGALFVASLGVGWVVAGRVLRPIGRITSVARDIQATDLSRRIDLAGPDDELKELADTFDGMLERLDRAFETQRRFIQDASHELRNPLAVIRTNLDVTLADPDASVDDLRQTGEVVGRSADRIARLVDDLLTYARHEDLALQEEPVDVTELVAEVAEEFVAPAETRGLRLEQSAAPHTAVVGDANAIKRAVANLLANAVRLGPENSTIRLTAGREGPWAYISVADEGPGIPTEEQPLVFQRFYRSDKHEARENGRSGLGLAIVRQIVEAHRGEVALSSTAGGGSTFVLWFPALVDHDGDGEDDQQPTQPNQLPLGATTDAT